MAALEHLPLMGPDGTPATLAPISAAVIARLGSVVYVSGQAAIDLGTGALLSDTITGQTELALDAIASELGRAGATLADVVRAECYLASAADFADFNAVFGARFGVPAPARTTIVCDFVLPGVLVEIQVTAIPAPAT